MATLARQNRRGYGHPAAVKSPLSIRWGVKDFSPDKDRWRNSGTPQENNSTVFTRLIGFINKISTGFHRQAVRYILVCIKQTIFAAMWSARTRRPSADLRGASAQHTSSGTIEASEPTTITSIWSPACGGGSTEWLKGYDAGSSVGIALSCQPYRSNRPRV